MSSTPPTSTSPDEKIELPSTIEIVLIVPKATIYQSIAPTSEKKLIGSGELRVYSSILEDSTPSMESTASSAAPPTTFFTLENKETSLNASQSLITHPLMPRSSAQKVSDRVWRFTLPGDGHLELQLPEASEEDITSLEDILTDRIVYTNQHELRNKLALVDGVGEIYGVLDEEDVEMDDDDNISLSENQKSPVVVHAIEPSEEYQDKPLKLKVSVPSGDDMASYITSASQSFGDHMVKGATFVAGGIASSGAYINSRVPEIQKPLVISPIIKKSIRKVTKVSRVTLSVTTRVKSAILSTAFNTGYRALRYWTAKDDREEYSTMQNLCYSVLNSAGILIEATEQSVGIITEPVITATQNFAGRALGPDARDIVTDALEGFKNLYLVYFDSAGISRRAFLRTSRLAALRTAKEVKEGKIKLKERKKDSSNHAQETSISLTATAGAAVSHAKELVFKYVGKTDDNASGSSSPKVSSSSPKVSSSSPKASSSSSSSAQSEKKNN
ncbi:hypothetical protein BGZ80_010675 [Entomortierella chlamydospora]|uniref:Senescence domain-containing protein n=1 Tax=Entomortierella chlamydospora TaxID=101097 RepID=A0A9P6N3T4_9FUNG|nr:hypothetical protein BGZ79_004204 [Entomortierella chlamydospora]KAG0022987.1 hypothetical protein BGZ80_010675 [Entomortierella chlamydospora]